MSLTAGVCALFESVLKQRNPGLRAISYDVAQLFSFIDSMGDLCCLVFQVDDHCCCLD